MCIAVGVLLLLLAFFFMLFQIVKSVVRRRIRSSSLRAVTKYSFQPKRFTLPVIRDPGFRAPEVSRCEPFSCYQCVCVYVILIESVGALSLNNL